VGTREGHPTRRRDVEPPGDRSGTRRPTVMWSRVASPATRPAGDRVQPHHLLIPPPASGREETGLSAAAKAHGISGHFATDRGGRVVSADGLQVARGYGDVTLDLGCGTTRQRSSV